MCGWVQRGLFASANRDTWNGPRWKYLVAVVDSIRWVLPAFLGTTTSSHRTHQALTVGLPATPNIVLTKFIARTRLPSTPTEHCSQARSNTSPIELSISYMPSALTKAEQSTPTLQTASDPTPTSQHGQRLEDNSRRSLLPHARGSQGEPEPPTGGNECDAPLPDALAYNLHHAVETSELRDSRPVTHPYRERVTLCESARAASLRKPSEGPLFEVTSSNGVLNGDISPIAKLPNGTRTPCRHSTTQYAETKFSNTMQRCSFTPSRISRPTTSPLCR